MMRGHSCDNEGSMKMGPWGGNAGTYWSFQVSKGGIIEVIVSHGEVIDSIRLKGDDGKGNIEYSERFGGNGGITAKVSLDWPREYLTTISGTFDSFDGWHVTRSLCFHTNKAKYGPYGKNSGDSFIFPIEGVVVVGFHGRSGAYVDAIGIYVKQAISFCSCPQVVSTQKITLLDFSSECLVGIIGLFALCYFLHKQGK